MTIGDYLWLAYYLAILILFAFVFYLRKIPRTYLTDYMRGVRFVKGSFVDILGPGSYQPLSRNVQIEIVDMRPVPFILDSVAYQDALQNESVMSIAAEMLVDDPHLAVTAIKNPLQDTVPIVRDTLRSFGSHTVADMNPEFRMRVASDITMAANQELHKFGIKIANVEVTEVFSRAIVPRRIATNLN